MKNASKRIEILCNYVLESEGEDYGFTVESLIDEGGIELTPAEAKALEAWNNNKNYSEKDFRSMVLKADACISHVYAQAWLTLYGEK